MTAESPSTGLPPHRPRRIGRWIVISMVVLLVVLPVLGIGYRIVALPAVEEPFDIARFVSVAVTHDQNAFTYYRQAKDRLVPRSPSTRDGAAEEAFWKSYDETISKGWSHANADVRAYLQSNEPALDTWKRGTECSRAMEIPLTAQGTHDLPDVMTSREFARLALLEAARQSAGNTLAKAWMWYRALLRSSRHVGMHAAMIGRLVAVALHGLAVEPVLVWSSRPELKAADLRRALADVLAMDEMTPPLSENFKAEYLFCRRSLEDSTAGWQSLPVRLVGYPERAQDALSLVYANWLTQVDRPGYLRRPARQGEWMLFEFDPKAPHDPRALPPAEIEKRCRLSQHSMESATISLLIPAVSAFLEAADRERARQSALVLGLALELYRREHGRFPATLEELVHEKILKEIPADPFGKGEVFHYRRETDAKKGALLWSVWLDGVDQKGMLSADKDVEGSAGDKTFRIAVPR